MPSAQQVRESYYKHNCIFVQAHEYIPVYRAICPHIRSYLYHDTYPIGTPYENIWETLIVPSPMFSFCHRFGAKPCQGMAFSSRNHAELCWWMDGWMHGWLQHTVWRYTKPKHYYHTGILWFSQFDPASSLLLLVQGFRRYLGAKQVKLGVLGKIDRFGRQPFFLIVFPKISKQHSLPKKSIRMKV